MIKVIALILTLIVCSQSTYLLRSAYSNTKLLGLWNNYTPIRIAALNNQLSFYNYLDRSFLTRDILGDGSTWVYPTTQTVYQAGWTASYTSTFTAFYNQELANFRVAATGTYYVYLNDVLVQTLWPYPKINTLSLRLLCGVNTIRIQVYNFVSSPIAVIYSLSQSTTSVTRCTSYLSPNYQFCIPRTCLLGYYWNNVQCACLTSQYQCLPRACSNSYYWSYQTCRCQFSYGIYRLDG